MKFLVLFAAGLAAAAPFADGVSNISKLTDSC
jgi:hypothetical protein